MDYNSHIHPNNSVNYRKRIFLLGDYESANAVIRQFRIPLFDLFAIGLEKFFLFVPKNSTYRLKTDSIVLIDFFLKILLVLHLFFQDSFSNNCRPIKPRRKHTRIMKKLLCSLKILKKLFYDCSN